MGWPGPFSFFLETRNSRRAPHKGIQKGIEGHSNKRWHDRTAVSHTRWYCCCCIQRREMRMVMITDNGGVWELFRFGLGTTLKSAGITGSPSGNCCCTSAGSIPVIVVKGIYVLFTTAVALWPFMYNICHLCMIYSMYNREVVIIPGSEIKCCEWQQ